MQFIDLYRKAENYWIKNKSVYHLTEEDLLSVLTDDDYFVFSPVFWEDEYERYNYNLVEKFEIEGYLIRSDRTENPDLLNPTYVYYKI